MKAIKILILLSIALFLTATSVSADGGVFVTDYEEHVYLPEQKAAVFWNGHEETLILSTKIKTGNLENLAWVIPIPSDMEPDVSEGNIEVFYELAELFPTYGRGKGSSIGYFISFTFFLLLFLGVVTLFFSRKKRKNKDLSTLLKILSIIFFVSVLVTFIGFFLTQTFGGLGEGGVNVVDIKKVDIYDVAILKATNATDLVNWLNDNGYVTPEAAVSVLQDYCDYENFWFIANKINLKNKCEGLTEGEYQSCVNEYTNKLNQGVATPLEIIFSPDQPFYPMKISSINEGFTKINVYIIAESPCIDEMEILELERTSTRSIYGWIEAKAYDINDPVVSLLKYEGNLKNLKRDSIFLC